MPVLADPRHEAFCQARLNGRTIDQAYKDAGFKANRGNAGALNAKQHIKARMEELLKERHQKAEEEGRWSAQALFGKMNDLIDKAAAAGDIKTAIDGQKFVLTCFGYEDSPTLTHEHVKGQKLAQSDKEGAGEASEGGDVSIPRSNVTSLEKALKELKRRKSA